MTCVILSLRHTSEHGHSEGQATVHAMRVARAQGLPPHLTRVPLGTGVWRDEVSRVKCKIGGAIFEALPMPAGDTSSGAAGSGRLTRRQCTAGGCWWQLR